MNDKMLVERVIAWLDGGCSSWNVPSSDIRQMATRIEALEAALRRIKDATDNEMRAGDKGYVSRYGIHGIATKALEGTGNG